VAVAALGAGRGYWVVAMTKEHESSSRLLSKDCIVDEELVERQSLPGRRGLKKKLPIIAKLLLRRKRSNVQCSYEVAPGSRQDIFVMMMM
jgi:hypothetical protein